jgi:hypothetical protein
MEKSLAYSLIFKEFGKHTIYTKISKYKTKKHL